MDHATEALMVLRAEVVERAEKIFPTLYGNMTVQFCHFYINEEGLEAVAGADSFQHEFEKEEGTAEVRYAAFNWTDADQNTFHVTLVRAS